MSTCVESVGSRALLWRRKLGGIDDDSLELGFRGRSELQPAQLPLLVEHDDRGQGWRSNSRRQTGVANDFPFEPPLGCKFANALSGQRFDVDGDERHVGDLASELAKQAEFLAAWPSPACPKREDQWATLRERAKR